MKLKSKARRSLKIFEDIFTGNYGAKMCFEEVRNIFNEVRNIFNEDKSLVSQNLAQRLIEVRWGSVEDTRVPEGVFEDTGTCVED
ncbi:hypothetical protein H4Q26_007979 [Puccinia striiformis f. sp. tritici PST-130]|nr:hypothetical protein H4Q26_007979 [Puccinia striiformis f. sp. tritici PST-130]